MAKTIGVLTGGGDVPGLNTVIRDLTYRALRESGFEVIGIKRGWGGLIYMDPSNPEIDPEHVLILNEENVRTIDKEGGTKIHTSRIKPSEVENHLNLREFRGITLTEKVDMTEDVFKNLGNLGIDVLVAIGGDDTLSYALHLHDLGFYVLGVPKTMDNDVPGTDYCIGFLKAIEKSKSNITNLIDPVSSNERIGVIELFGRNSGFTALYAALAAKQDRVLIPEVDFDMDKLTELLVEDRNKNPERYSIVAVSEGAKQAGGQQIYEKEEKDAYGHKKLGGIGKIIADHIKKTTGIDTISEGLRYLLRSGPPNAKDKIVSSVFANIIMDAILEEDFGKMAAVRDGRYCLVPLEETLNSPKLVDVEKFYNADRYRPNYKNLRGSLVLV